MKTIKLKNRLLLIAVLLFFTINFSSAQENSITISGGYSFGNIESVDDGITGWRINALYEFAAYEGNFSHGSAIGYINTKVTTTDGASNPSKLQSDHWVFYYVPKYTFGNSETWRPFVKGALGFHISGYDYDLTLPISGQLKTGDDGFYGGLGAGIAINVSSNVLINLEYEWAYLSNSWYRDGFLSSAMLGVGIRF
jgi:opacity protein-like surface antigen